MKASGSHQEDRSAVGRVRQLGEMTWQDVDGLDRETAVFPFVCENQKLTTDR